MRASTTTRDLVASILRPVRPVTADLSRILRTSAVSAAVATPASTPADASALPATLPRPPQGHASSAPERVEITAPPPYDPGREEREAARPAAPRSAEIVSGALGVTRRPVPLRDGPAARDGEPASRASIPSGARATPIPEPSAPVPGALGATRTAVAPGGAARAPVAGAARARAGDALAPPPVERRAEVLHASAVASPSSAGWPSPSRAAFPAAPSAPPSPALHAPLARLESAGAAPQRSAGEAALAGALEPIWDESRRITHAALTVERSRGVERGVEHGAVNNTFNVSVHVPSEGAPADREALEQAITDILRDAARRHGLEV
jgi:hypothetical protein